MTATTLTTPNRLLPLQHCLNGRDLGGLTNQNGQRLKTNRLWRTDALSQFAPSDLQLLQTLPLHTIVDFRTETERTREPNAQPSEPTNTLNLDILSGNMAFYMQQIQQQDADARAIMLDMYADLVLHPHAQLQYRHFFALLQEPPQGTLVFHCSAGKDRTGIAAALILAALNVDDDTIMADYLLSNDGLLIKYGHLIAAHPHLKDFLTVSADFLEHAWRLIAQHHGSVSLYLQQVLQVDTQRMQQLYLEAQ